MKKLTLLLLAAAAWAGDDVESKAAQRAKSTIESLDADGDGRVSKDEFLGSDSIFERWDADKDGVFGSAEFVGWYNGHPDFQHLDPNLDTPNVALIGNGNVAIDIARVLVKSPEEMAQTDIPDEILERISAAPITDVYMFGRRGPVEAKFTNVELREMGQLADAHPVIDPTLLPDAVEGDWSDRDRRLREKNLETLRGFTELDPDGKTKRVHFEFYAKPVEILGGDAVEGIRFERTRVVDGHAEGRCLTQTLQPIVDLSQERVIELDACKAVGDKGCPVVKALAIPHAPISQNGLDSSLQCLCNCLIFALYCDTYRYHYVTAHLDFNL